MERMMVTADMAAVMWGAANVLACGAVFSC
jgi:hypothetical protein